MAIIKNIRRSFQIVIITIVVFALYWFVLLSLPAVETLRLKSLDVYYNLRRRFIAPPPQLNDIAIITIDPQTQQSINLRWPWDRGVYSEILEKIHQYHPALIYFNLLFIGVSPDNPQGDLEFAEALAQAPETVLASTLESSGRLVLPYKQFLLNGKISTGFSSKIMDIDSAIRRGSAYHLSPQGDIDQYCIEAVLAGKFRDIPASQTIFRQDNKIDSPRPPLDRQGSIYINYMVPPNEFSVFSLTDLLENRIPPNQLKDKIVLLGSTLHLSRTKSQTPLGIMDGIFIIGNSLTMFLSNRYLRDIPEIWLMGTMLLFILLVGYVTYRKYIFKSLIFLLFSCLWLFLLGLYLFFQEYLFDYFSFCAAGILMYIFTGFFRHAVLLQEKIAALTKANIAIRSAQQELVRKEQLAVIGRMTSQIIHEFSHPVGDIQSSLEFINKKIPAGSEHKELISNAYEAALSLTRLSKQLKHSYTPHIKELVSTDINALIAKVLAGIKQRLAKKDLTVKTTYDSRLPPMDMSPDKIQQVIENLLINASDALNREGEITISTTTGKQNGKKAIIINIADNGCGIHHDELTHIFDAFYTTKQGGEGSGLGLFICLEIIKAHGGTIEVDSKIDKGTTFTLILPFPSQENLNPGKNR